MLCQALPCCVGLIAVSFIQGGRDKGGAGWTRRVKKEKTYMAKNTAFSHFLLRISCLKARLCRWEVELVGGLMRVAEMASILQHVEAPTCKTGCHLLTQRTWKQRREDQ